MKGNINFPYDYQNKLSYNVFDNDWLETHQDYLDWGHISMNYTLNEEFIEQWADRLYWVSICMYQRLTESFMKK